MRAYRQPTNCLAAVIYVPFLEEPFGTFDVGWRDWALVVALAFFVMPVLETAKWMARHGRFGELQ